MAHNDYQRITHPTDFSRESEIAFNHALRLAVAAGCRLDLLHVDRVAQAVAMEEFPRVRETLKLWGMLPASGTDAIRVQKISEYGREPVHPILSHLADYPADLIVLATHRREGLDRWLHREVAGKVAREASVPALFVPNGVQGFVSSSTGQVTLRQVLVPIDWRPQPQAAIDAAATIAGLLGAQPRIHVLHVGKQDLDLPAVDLPAVDGLRWNQSVEPGEVLETIDKVAHKIDADLIVMATQGREGFLDALRGSTTEQVLQQAKCPVLAVPSLKYENL